ncbi:MAG TPA: phospholipase D-like domain-containing protein [Candidatus Saccharibacteria bacterium]|nr:phospholipase D-like domain-containing protein [Candidatus Saccharibacteria bacterium]
MNNSSLFDNNTFYKAFERDLRRARQSVIIESPFITRRRMEHLLPLLTKLRRKGMRIVVNTRNPEEHNEKYAIQSEDAVAAMQDIGIKVLYTVKHHRKLAIIDEEVLWEGSLNILSQGDSCEIMRRTYSNDLAKGMMHFIGLHG